jgi:hypothetical protein
MLGEMEGAEAQPIPAVGLRSRGLEHREERRKAKHRLHGPCEMADIRRCRGIAVVPRSIRRQARSSSDGSRSAGYTGRASTARSGRGKGPREVPPPGGASLVGYGFGPWLQFLLEVGLESAEGAHLWQLTRRAGWLTG